MPRDDAQKTERSSFFSKEFFGEPMFYVYVLQSMKTVRWYIGFSTDPAARLVAHNQSQNPSTKHGKPWQLIYLEGYRNKHDALGRERFLKSGSGHRYLHKQLNHFLEEK